MPLLFRSCDIDLGFDLDLDIKCHSGRSGHVYGSLANGQWFLFDAHGDIAVATSCHFGQLSA